MDRIDFKGLADRLLSNAESLLAQWYPEGVISGHEFKVGSIHGEPGDSLSVNLNTGQWADFAGDHRGGDLISLYAWANRDRLEQAMRDRGWQVKPKDFHAEAARELEGGTASMPAAGPARPKAPRSAPKWTPVLPVPEDAPAAPDRFARNEGTPKAPKWVDGEFVRRWTYLDADGRLLGHVARFEWNEVDAETGEIKRVKDVVPQTWCANAETGKSAWRTRSFPVPRPLYGLRELAERPEAPVLIVEGEKSADAARQICRQYVVVTWPGGVEAWRKAALNPLRGRPSVLLWPDADEPGTKGMWEVGHALLALVPTVKIILPEGKPDGWDAADALAEGWTWREFKAWAMPLARLITDQGEPDGTRTPADAALPVGTSPVSHAASAEDDLRDRARSPDVAQHGGRPAPRSGGDAPHAASAPDRASVGGLPARTQAPASSRVYREPVEGEGAGPGAEVHPDDGTGAQGARAERAQPGSEVAAQKQPESQVACWSLWNLDKSGTTGLPLANLNNAYKVLESDFRLRDLVWFDEFLQRLMTTGFGPGLEVREWRDDDDVRLTLFMQSALGLQKMGVQTVNQAVIALARQRPRNCVLEWLGALPAWDGVDRCGSFFVDVFGAVDTAYARAAAHNFWVAMIARAKRPGCKVDNVVVLEGMQGKKKSSALSLLVSDVWFAEAQEDITSKDFYVGMQGKWLIEISELDAFSRADVATIKRVVTSRVDRYRPPYGRAAVDHPRMSVFVATTNKDDWNKDETGARRFWPIRCAGDIRHDLIIEQRTQLFAEALARFNAGESWWEMPEEETLNEQEKRFQADPWFDRVSSMLGPSRQLSGVTTSELMDDLEIEVARQDRGAEMRVGSILRKLGWTRKQVRDGSDRSYRYFPSSDVVTGKGQIPF